jgi:outer membrane protein OmpA-like peptidoglycan-associated protein
MVSRYVVLLGLLAAVVAASGCGSSGELQNQIVALDKQVAGLQEQVVAREADVASLRDTRTKLEKDIDTLTLEKADLKALTEIVVFREVPETLSYGVDQYHVQDDMKAALTSVAQAARENPEFDLYVVGYTDRLAQDAETQYYLPTAWELAAFRATSVARFLIDREGLPADKVIACSVGDARLIAPVSTEAGRAQNRRVTFFLRKPEAPPATPELPSAGIDSTTQE